MTKTIRCEFTVTEITGEPGSQVAKELYGYATEREGDDVGTSVRQAVMLLELASANQYGLTIEPSIRVPTALMEEMMLASVKKP